MHVAPLIVVGMIGGGVTAVVALAMLLLVVWQAPRARENQLLALLLGSITAWGVSAFLARLAPLVGGDGATNVRTTVVTILLSSTLLHVLVLHYADEGARWWAKLSIAVGLLFSVVLIPSGFLAGFFTGEVGVLGDGRIRFRMLPTGYAAYAFAFLQCALSLALAVRNRRRRTGWLLPGTALLVSAVVGLVTPLGRLPIPILTAAFACVLLTRAILGVKLFSPLHAANRELMGSRARLFALVDNTDDAIWSIDPEMRLTAFNSTFRDRMKQATGRVFSEGDSALEWLSPELRAVWQPLYQRALGGERFFVDRRLGSGSTQREFEIALNPIRDDDRVLGVALLAHDVTERKQGERLKDEFVATVSHELRTPLTAILGALGLLRGGALGEMPPASIEMLEMLDRNGHRLLALVNDLLDLQRLRAGAVEFVVEETPLAPLLAQAIELHQSYAAGFDVTLRLDQVDDCVLLVDRERLMQVLANLLSNAAKFSRAGGEVVLSAERSPGDVDRDRVVLSVRDRGVGIPAEFHARVFDKFAQADGSTARARGGTGLGLAITREIVERLHGTIRFESAEGEGTTFFVELTPTRWN